jgi:hypothetical protein
MQQLGDMSGLESGRSSRSRFREGANLGHQARRAAVASDHHSMLPQVNGAESCWLWSRGRYAAPGLHVGGGQVRAEPEDACHRQRGMNLCISKRSHGAL